VLAAREVWLTYRCRWQMNCCSSEPRGCGVVVQPRRERRSGCWRSCWRRCWGWWCCTGRRCCAAGFVRHQRTRLMRKAAEFAKQIAKALTKQPRGAVRDPARDDRRDGSASNPGPRDAASPTPRISLITLDCEASYVKLGAMGLTPRSPVTSPLHESLRGEVRGDLAAGLRGTRWSGWSP